MNKDPRFTIIITAVVMLVLVLSAVRPITVFADDATIRSDQITQETKTRNSK